MHSTSYIVRFVLIMTAIVAVILAFLSTALKPIHSQNEAVYNKRAVLKAVQVDLGSKVSDLSDKEVLDVFTNQISQKVFDMSGKELTKEE
ncbi:MAG: hypothetical protein IPN72_18805 [Saprospiraceae bacterium]|nr:hypothetical protein [Saprospiraceae bacterium]